MRERDRRQAPDLVERNLTAERPNQLWVADTTCIPTWSGFLYLSVVLPPRAPVCSKGEGRHRLEQGTCGQPASSGSARTLSYR